MESWQGHSQNKTLREHVNISNFFFAIFNAVLRFQIQSYEGSSTLQGIL